MTSKHWKERRERFQFRQDLEDYYSGPSNGSFENIMDDLFYEDMDDPYNDDPYDTLDWDDYGDNYGDNYIDLCEDPLLDYIYCDDGYCDVLPCDVDYVSPGDHVKNIETGDVFLILENYHWASLFTGRMTSDPRRYVDVMYEEKVF